MTNLVGLYIFTVVTVDGSPTTHNYPLPPTEREQRELIKELIEKIFEALTGVRSTLYLQYPMVIYQSQHIVRVEAAGMGTEDLRQAMEKAQRGTGLLAQKRASGK